MKEPGCDSTWRSPRCPFDNDIVADRQSQTGSCPVGLVVKKVEDLITDLTWDAGSVVAYTDQQPFAFPSRRDRYRRFELLVAGSLSFIDCVEGVVDDVEDDPADVLPGMIRACGRSEAKFRSMVQLNAGSFARMP